MSPEIRAKAIALLKDLQMIYWGDEHVMLVALALLEAQKEGIEIGHKQAEKELR